MNKDSGVPASPSGHSAEPEPISVVSAQGASVPNAALADLAAAETEAMREATGLKDWHYRDLPQLSPEFFDKFVEMVGKDNLRWITYAERQWPDGSRTKRGQVMISPEGMDRIAAHNAASAGEAGTATDSAAGVAEGEHATAAQAAGRPNTVTVAQGEEEI